MSHSPDETVADQRFRMECYACERIMMARAAWVGREVACPYCHTCLRVPEPPDGDIVVRSRRPRRAAKLGFNFACPRCDCMLEADTGMSGVVATCPTCAARVRVPFVTRSGRVGRAELISTPAETPVPTHAYAASGHQAPVVVETDDGLRMIRCPRCNANNPIDADRCDACATPFTMEAAPTVESLKREHGNRTAIGLGILGLLLFPIALPSLAAIAIGLRTVFLPAASTRATGAWAGIGMGVCGLIGALVFWLL